MAPAEGTAVALPAPIAADGTPQWTPEILEIYVHGAWGVRVPGMRFRSLDPPTLDPATGALVITGEAAPPVPTCPGHVTPWAAFCAAFFAASPVEVWKASRGFGGKTSLLALLTLTEAIVLEADVTLLGGSGQQSQRVHEAAERYWAWPDAPRHRLRGERLQRETRLSSGNWIRALMASTRSTRGLHPQRLRLDEVDETSLRIIDAALGQAQGAVRRFGFVRDQTVLSSTHQYADGPMSEILRRAASRGHPVSAWCYRETLQPHGWLSEDAVRSKRLTVTATTWEAEYELQDPDPGDRAIDPAAVARMFRRDLRDVPHREWQYHEFEPPHPGARYATGADWARSVDFTVIPTLRVDCRPMRLVAWERGQRRSWPFMIGRFAERLKRYKGPATHDASGIGDVIAQYIPQRGSLPPIDDFVFTAADRDALLGAYILSVEHGEIIAPFLQVAEAEHRLASRRTVFGGGHLPDTIAALALARRAAGFVSRGTPVGVGEGRSYWRSV